ncbi:uncharacterized protein [Neodiprion pinetum]|uniref:uncharacterized protein n=1 Tax=Neodiprion pinetum TaxID=441929 RepID=UPI001EE04930|nr:uncharacterized protein LOC124224070 [Neodiprion pinetum]
MTDLPWARVNGTVAFLRVGVDHFGPVFVKEKKFRNQKFIKSYGCVFVCMATKDVHLEIPRVLGQRDKFRRSKQELRELYALLETEELQQTVATYATQRNIIWRFNPPLSPHFGGLWEAAVTAFKHHFIRVVRDQAFTIEEFSTMAIKIEAILNSRPLCSLSSDPNDPVALAPAHILIGRPLTRLPEADLSDVPNNRLTVWNFISKFQKRQKWQKTTVQLHPGAVVILIEKNQPCMRRPLGIIRKVHPSDDGVVRVATVKTMQGEYKRNCTQLYPLPDKL